MADRTKRTYRGRTYYAKSTRPGKKRVKVKAHCRRKPKTFAQRFARNDLPF